MTDRGTTALSVLTPSYNYEPYLGTCVRSVRSQGEPVQHVVVDDGSSDGSWDLLMREHANPLADCARHANRGLSGTLNAALAMAGGSWLSWLNSDDFELPWTLSTVRRVLDQVPDADVVVGDTVLVDERSRLIRLVSRGPFDPRVLSGGFNPFFVPSVFWRRSRRPQWVFDESMKLLMDMDLWLAVTAGGATVVKVDVPLSAFRNHPQQISASRRPGDVEEMRTLGERYGIARLATAKNADATPGARYRHASSRLSSGAATREWRARHLRGANADWTGDEPFGLGDLAPGDGDLRLHVRRPGGSRP